MTLPKWLQEIEARQQAATPGPWFNTQIIAHSHTDLPKLLALAKDALELAEFSSDQGLDTVMNQARAFLEKWKK